MSTVSMSGSDAITINGHIFNDLADQNCVELDFPNDIASSKTGKNGNSIYVLNQTGKVVDVKMRIIRASNDDKFLLNLLSQQNLGFASFVLMFGTFVKKIGDGLGNVTSDTYILSGGLFVKNVPGKDNVEGDIESGVAMYSLRFTNAPRVLT